jgi:hypothetical protein
MNPRTALREPAISWSCSRPTFLPLDMWHSMGANFFFSNLRKLCCVKCCVTETHFTVLHAFVMLQWGKMILPSANLWLPNDDIIVVRLSVVDTWCLSSAHPRNSAPPPPPPLPRPGSRHRMRKATRPTAAVTAHTQMIPPRPSLMARRRASSLKIGMTCRLLLST